MKGETFLDLALDVRRRSLVLAARVLFVHGVVVLVRVLAALQDHDDERLQLGEGVSGVVHVGRSLHTERLAKPRRVVSRTCRLEDLPSRPS